MLSQRQRLLGGVLGVAQQPQHRHEVLDGLVAVELALGHHEHAVRAAQREERAVLDGGPGVHHVGAEALGELGHGEHGHVAARSSSVRSLVGRATATPG